MRYILRQTIKPTETPATNTWNAYPNYPNIADSARWYWGDGTSTTGFYPTHTYSTTGQYTICATAYSMCGDTVSFCLVDTISNIIKVINTGNPNNPTNPIFIKEQSLSKHFNIYPNPTSIVLNLSSDIIEMKQLQIEIINYLGQMVLSTEYANTIDVSKLPNGIYTLRIFTKENRNFYSKFVKE